MRRRFLTAASVHMVAAVVFALVTTIAAVAGTYSHRAPGETITPSGAHLIPPALVSRAG